MKGKTVEDILREHVADNKCVFVFPTQTACELWADKAISIGSTKAVATQRFIAWDEFKSTSVRGVTQDKSAIPATLRKIFVHMLIERNAKEHFFSNLIPTEYADSASNFAAWISSLLPSLAQWKKRSEKSTLEKDEEDKDLDKLYSLYKEFLDQRKLFEPAWEMPPLRDDGNKYFIFFPEILMDWSEYKEILESGSNIEIIEVPKIEEEEKPICHFFANSREELRNMAIYLRKIHQEKNIPWNKIAISVPDMETYEPYIERELSLYMIPCVLRNGKPLTQSGAGNFFLQAAECAQSNFSFESLKTLLLNNELPWKEKDLNEQLIVFGQENNCLCSYEYKGKKTDVWEEAFKMSGKEERLFNFYKKLKQDITNLSNATSFKNIRTQYFILRNDFFDMSVCPVFSDFIMSRCISELSSLIDLEEEYPDCTVSAPYSFFTDYIKDKMYVEQTQELGVQILPYRLSAAAPFEVQLVIDASQSSLGITYKQLGFLNDVKRQALGFKEDPNVSDLFITLYHLCAGQESYFSAASKTFSGYGISHAFFKEANHIPSEKNYTPPNIAEDSDFYTAEKNWMLQKENSNFPPQITSVEKEGFCSWEENQCEEESEKEATLPQGISRERLKEIFQSKYCKQGALQISATMLRKFYECPRSFLFDSVMSLKEKNNEAELMDYFAMGDLYHKILELFCKALAKNDLPLTAPDGMLSDEYKAILDESIKDAIEGFKASPLAKQLMVTTKDALTQVMTSTVSSFCKSFEGCKVVESEAKYSYTNKDPQYICTGKIDCLLKNEDQAEFILVDFKSSDNSIPKESFYFSEDVQVPDFQMPVYLNLLSKAENPKNVENCVFFSIKDYKVRGVTGSLFCKEEIDFLPTMEKVDSLINDFCGRIKNLDFSIKDFDIEAETCRSCAYKSVCRRTFTVAGAE